MMKTTTPRTKKCSQDVEPISRHETHTRCQFPPLNRMPIELERIHFIVRILFCASCEKYSSHCRCSQCFRWHNLILLLVRWFRISAYYRNKWMVNDGNKFTIFPLAEDTLLCIKTRTQSGKTSHVAGKVSMTAAIGSNAIGRLFGGIKFVECSISIQFWCVEMSMSE